MDLGSFVRERRRALNLTQTQLADLAGVGLNFVYQLEKNKPSVQMDCTQQVLKALGFELAVEPTASTNGLLASHPHPRRTLPWD